MVSLHARSTTALVAVLLAAAPWVVSDPIPASAAVPTAATESRGPKSIASDQDLNAWLTYYYLHPQPELVVPATLLAEKKGYLNSESGGPYMAFLSRVFAQNPTKIAGWNKELEVAIQPKSKPILWTALWWSHTKESGQLLDEIAKTLSPKTQTSLLEQIAKPPEPIEKMDINHPNVVDMLWGAFFATGDEKYIQRLISVLSWETQSKDLNKMQVAASVRWSLTSNAEQHPAVLQICQQVREKQPDLRTVLDPVIEKATKNLATATTPTNNR